MQSVEPAFASCTFHTRLANLAGGLAYFVCRILSVGPIHTWLFPSSVSNPTTGLKDFELEELMGYGRQVAYYLLHIARDSGASNRLHTENVRIGIDAHDKGKHTSGYPNVYENGYFSEVGPETYNYEGAEEDGGEYPLSVKNPIFWAANSRILMSIIKDES